MNIVIYTKSGCPACVTAKRLLDDRAHCPGCGFQWNYEDII